MKLPQKTILSSELPKVLEVKDGVTVIPTGYKWCGSCGALTPHTEARLSHFFKCSLCGNSVYGESCPNCGYDPSNECENSSYYDEIQHDENCPVLASKREKNRWWENHLEFDAPIRKIRLSYPKIIDGDGKCDCPTVRIYPITNVFNYKGGHSSGYYGGTWWTYDIRCPICGDIFEVEDSSD